jgi:xylulokinase
MTTSGLLCGVDVGTSSAKCVVTDTAGRLVAEHSAGYEVSTPKPLWAEQWPDVWLDGLARAVRGVLDHPRVDPSAVLALTVSSLYGGSGVPVDADLEPVYPCLIWMDRRARAATEWVRTHVDLDRLVQLTGNGVDSYYGFAKMLWLQHNEPDVWRRTRWLVPPNAFVIQRLTGELAVDHSSAGNIGGVYDIHQRAWSPEACDLLGLDIAKLPEPLVASHDVVGTLHREGARRLGLASGTPVCAGGVDAPAATLSAGVVAEGRHVAMMGTSMCWGFVHTAPPTEAGLVSMPYVLQPETLVYTFGGAATAGAVPAWFVDQLGASERTVEQLTADIDGPDAYAQLEGRAARVPPGSDGVVMLPYFMGERSPIWDPDARGTITGLTLYHTKAHLYRAGLEAVAFALRHNLETGRAAGYHLADEVHLVGGAARSPLWCAIIANVVNLPVTATHGGEAAYGDAMLGAVATGVADAADVASWTAASQRDHRIEPDPTHAAAYEATYPRYLALYEALADYFAASAATA